MPESEISRRDFLKKSAILGTGMVIGGSLLSNKQGEVTNKQITLDESKKPEAEITKPKKVVQPELRTANQVMEWLPEPVKQLWPIIQAESQKYQLDPRLIAIIITEESGGLNIANTEGSGAMGPMQLMPIVMQEYAMRSGDRQPRNINNPQDNIMVGCWLVNMINEQYIEKSGIDLYSDLGILMLAVGYGDGIGALRAWQRDGMQPTQLSSQAKKVSRIWIGMWHEKDQPSSPTLNFARGYNT
jgi:hypothetical protein